MFKELPSQERLIIEKIKYVNELLRTGKVGVSSDIDNTEVYTALTAVTMFNRLHNTGYAVADLKDAYGMTKWSEELGIADGLEHAKEIWNSKEVIEGSEPIPGSVILSRYLYNEKIIIPRITSRPFVTKGSTYAWYKNNMPWVDPVRDINFRSGPEINPVFKVSRIKDLGVNYHFEDIPSDAEDIARESPDTTVIIIPHPWNEDYHPTNPRIVKLDSHLEHVPKSIQIYLKMVDLVAQSY
jgi:hypothetical protein